MKCGVSSRRKQIRVGYGMLLTMAVARYWRMSLGGGKIAFFCNCKRCWSPLASRGITPMGGGLTSGIWMLINIEWARTTRRKLGAVPLSRERLFDVLSAHQPGRKDAPWKLQVNDMTTPCAPTAAFPKRGSRGSQGLKPVSRLRGTAPESPVRYCRASLRRALGRAERYRWRR